MTNETLDKIIDKMELSDIIVHRSTAKKWLFEYACQYVEEQGLKPTEQTNYISYVMICKAQHILDKAKETIMLYDVQEMNVTLNLNKLFAYHKGIPNVVRHDVHKGGGVRWYRKER